MRCASSRLTRIGTELSGPAVQYVLSTTPVDVERDSISTRPNAGNCAAINVWMGDELGKFRLVEGWLIDSEKIANKNTSKSRSPCRLLLLISDIQSSEQRMTTSANEKRVSLSEIMSIVHDLRNPLSTIHGSAELLIGNGLSEPQIRRVSAHIYDASVRINELLEECLTRYQHPDSGPEYCGLADLVNGAVQKVALRAHSQSVQIFQNVPKGLLVTIDRQRIQRVFVNLLTNALDVMPDGGEVHIGATPEQHSVIIKVRDSGPGIAPEIRERLFHPFATAGKVDGLGLGLAFSRRALVEHGGNIWTEPAGEGACFALRLPQSRAPQTPPDADLMHAHLALDRPDEFG
jgi:signal transduction histidine kinase